MCSKRRGKSQIELRLVRARVNSELLIDFLLLLLLMMRPRIDESFALTLSRLIESPLFVCFFSYSFQIECGATLTRYRYRFNVTFFFVVCCCCRSSFFLVFPLKCSAAVLSSITQKKKKHEQPSMNREKNYCGSAKMYSSRRSIDTKSMDVDTLSGKRQAKKMRT